MRQSHPLRAIALALVLSCIGATLKLWGALAYGSKAVLVDGLTCASNLAAGFFALASACHASRPPDEEHHYGHERLQYLGVLASMLAYAFVAGIAVSEVAKTQPYHVDERAAAYAIAGGAVYALSILASRRGGVAGQAYASFTASELIESVVTAAAAYAGATLSYIIDYAGALALTLYIFYELYEYTKKLMIPLSDRAPDELAREVRELLERHGVHVERLRLRVIVPGRYHGDALVSVPGRDYDSAHELVDRLVDELHRRGVDLTVHIEPSPSRKRGESREEGR